MKHVGWFGFSVASALMMIIGSLYGSPLLYKVSGTTLFAKEALPRTIKLRPRLEPARNVARIAPWRPGELPHVAAGLAISVYATGLNRPRWLYSLPNGDILVAETGSVDAQAHDPTHRLAERVQNATLDAYSANRITLLRDSKGVGLADLKTPFLRNMYLPFGMALIGKDFYVATADAITRYPYESGQTEINALGTHIINLPTYGYNWAKNILPSHDGQSLYVTLNKTEKILNKPPFSHKMQSSIMRLNLQDQTMDLYTAGLPAPFGLAADPCSTLLWVVLDDFRKTQAKNAKDYITPVTDGMTWLPPLPGSDNPKERRILSRWASLTLAPETLNYTLGSYTGAVALVFSYDSALPQTWRHGLFVSERGSWIHKPKHGYKVVYVPFENGKPTGKPQDVVTGFLNPEDTELRGRPMGLALDAAGALLIADDVGNMIWRITAATDTTPPTSPIPLPPARPDLEQATKVP